MIKIVCLQSYDFDQTITKAHEEQFIIDVDTFSPISIYDYKINFQSNFWIFPSLPLIINVVYGWYLKGWGTKISLGKTTLIFKDKFP